MQGLRPHRAQALLPVRGVSPACDDTNDPDERSQSNQVGRYGCFGETRVRNTKECKHQYQKVGPLPREKCAWVKIAKHAVRDCPIADQSSFNAPDCEPIERIFTTLHAPPAILPRRACGSASLNQFMHQDAIASPARGAP